MFWFNKVMCGQCEKVMFEGELLEHIKECPSQSGLKKYIKPPLGLRPRWLNAEGRVEEIKEAFNRAMEVNYPIEPDWLEEYNTLTKWLKERK